MDILRHNNQQMSHFTILAIVLIVMVKTTKAYESVFTLQFAYCSGTVLSSVVTHFPLLCAQACRNQCGCRGVILRITAESVLVSCDLVSSLRDEPDAEFGPCFRKLCVLLHGQWRHRWSTYRKKTVKKIRQVPFTYKLNLSLKRL